MLGARDIVLVPEGAEYRAVRRGVTARGGARPGVIPIPIGSDALRERLGVWKQSINFLDKPAPAIVLMGLAGSLSARHEVGEVVSYLGCGREDGEYFPCGVGWTEYPRVKGLTSARVIDQASEKRRWGQLTGYEVVDMEGAIVLEVLTGARVGIVRVIGDGVDRDLPDLQGAIDGDGHLKPVPLATCLLRRPLASFYLIRSSGRALKVLQKVARVL